MAGAILAALASRALDNSLCPSEVARVPDGLKRRGFTPAVRAMALTQAQHARIRLSQRGRLVNPPESRRGVSPLSLP
jgi:hypothetical protein